MKIIFSEADYKLAANSKIYFKCKLICTDINTNIWLLLIIKAIKQNCNRDFFQRSKGKIHFLNKNLPQNLRSYKFINILQNLFQLEICIQNLHDTKLFFFQRSIIIKIDFPRLDFLSHDFQMCLVKRIMPLPLLLPHLQGYRKMSIMLQDQTWEALLLCLIISVSYTFIYLSVKLVTMFPQHL